MSNLRLSERVAAEIAGHRRILIDLGMRAKGGLLAPHDEVLISNILVGCRLILDRAMNAVWASHNNQRPGKGKANVYFPCRPSAEQFDQALIQLQLSQLETVNAAAYQAIRSRQPFAGMHNSWLLDLFKLTHNKHENYVEIESTSSSEMRIGEGQSGHLRALILTPDGRAFADADMVDGKTGKSAPLRLTFTDNFNHYLRSTRQDPVSYCRQCLGRVEDTFDAVIATLS